MRAMFIGMVLSALGAAACGGETIRYPIKSPTSLPTEVAFTLGELEIPGDSSADSTLAADPTSRAELERLLQDFFPDERVELYDEVVVIEPELALRLLAWADEVRDGATSRAELESVCRRSPITNDEGIPPDAIAICESVAIGSHSRTLGDWADMIDERLGRYSHLYRKDFDDEDGE